MNREPNNLKPATTEPATTGTPVEHPCLMSRRDFLLTASAATATFTVLVAMNPGSSRAQQLPAAVALYPRKLIASFSRLASPSPRRTTLLLSWTP